jgi:Antibiotic biosynthesis monooxygenase
MDNVWTHGVWTVKPGREEEFVRAWNELARDALTEFTPVGPAYLLRERERPNVFRSFGPWDSIETVEGFRAKIAPRIGAMQELLESFEAFTLDEAARIG